MKLHFSGRYALILGGSCNLAITLAEYMIKADLFPILTYRSDRGNKRISERLQSLTLPGHSAEANLSSSDEGGNYDSPLCTSPVSKQWEAGKRYRSLYLNLGDRDSLNSMFSQIKGEIDFVVDFAQGDMECFIASAAEEDVSCYFAENISFRAEILKMISREMLKKKRGRFIFVSSSAAARPNPGQGFYAAAKLASEALYKNLGLELGRYGITTVTLRPGYIESGRGERYTQSRRDEVLKMIPTKRILTTAEVTETILFLLSDSASGFNATEIHLDGGLTACK